MNSPEPPRAPHATTSSAIHNPNPNPPECNPLVRFAYDGMAELWTKMSRSVTETVKGSQSFIIKGYSLAKGMGIGKQLSSDIFAVGCYLWAIYFYLDGNHAKNSKTFKSSRGDDLGASEDGGWREEGRPGGKTQFSVRGDDGNGRRVRPRMDDTHKGE